MRATGGGPARHVGYVLKRFPRISETFIASELIEMERQGERVTVFAISRPAEPFSHDFLRELAARVIYLPHRPSREPLRVAHAVAGALRASPRGLLSAMAFALRPPYVTGIRRFLQATVLREELAEHRVDHAHAHFATAAARLADLANRMGGPAYSVTAHAKDIYHDEVRPERLRNRLAGATFVATVTRANREYLERLTIGNGRVHVVPNCADLRRLEFLERRPEPGVVVTVARLVEKKGIADLISACALLRGRGVSVRLHVAGDGPLRERLELAAATAQVDARFHGALPHERVLELYQRASVFCLPCVVARSGDRDGLPTSVLEAMALGVPVVTTSVNGLAEAVIHERTGLVVPSHDAAALARAIERLLSDGSLAAQLSAEARRHVQQRFALARSVSTLRELIPAGP